MKKRILESVASENNFRAEQNWFDSAQMKNDDLTALLAGQREIKRTCEKRIRRRVRCN